MWGFSLVLYVVLSCGQKEFAVLRFETYSADIRFYPTLVTTPGKCLDLLTAVSVKTAVFWSVTPCTSSITSLLT